MGEPSTSFAPAWTWKATAAAAVLAVVTGFLPLPEEVTGVLVVAALLGAVYLLYRWGQQRERPAADEDDETARRQREMEAEAGGFGGNAGG